MILHTRTKSKTRRPTKQQLQLQREWEQLLAKHSKPLEKGSKRTVPLKDQPILDLKPPPGREGVKIKSLGGTDGVALKKRTLHYTGTNILGIAQMSKSNAVPVFSQQEAVDISKMRRN